MKENLRGFEDDQSFIDKFSEIAGAVLCVVMVIYTLQAMFRLQDTIATHFDSAGNPNGYSGKASLLWMLLMMVFMYVLFFVITRFPRIYNYVVRITDDNREIQQKMAVTFMRVIGLEIVALFAVIQWQIIEAALLGHDSLNTSPFFLIMVLLFGTTGYYIYQSIKNR